MNRQQLVDAVGERLGDRKQAAVAVEAVLDTVTAALVDGERVALFGFGVFEKVDRAARTARNPSTGGTVEVPATAVPRFRAGQALKDAVNGRPAGTSRSAPATGRTAAATGSARPKAKGTEDAAADRSAGATRTASKGKGKAAEGKGKAAKGVKAAKGGAKPKKDGKGKKA